MRACTVDEVARPSGVSVRTLHHDAIGPLKPAFVGDNRYRYYRSAELLRLQQILVYRSWSTAPGLPLLVYRELDIPLRAIAALLGAPAFDLAATLREQRRG